MRSRRISGPGHLSVGVRTRNLSLFLMFAPSRSGQTEDLELYCPSVPTVPVFRTRKRRGADR